MFSSHDKTRTRREKSTGFDTNFRIIKGEEKYILEVVVVSLKVLIFI